MSARRVGEIDFGSGLEVGVAAARVFCQFLNMVDEVGG